MRDLIRMSLSAGLIVLMAAPLAAQVNHQTYHNGTEYFFKNAIVPPSNSTTYVRSFGSATSVGNEWGFAEAGPVHPVGVQNAGLEAWTTQAGPGPSIAMPLGFSLLEFIRGGDETHGTGNIVASGSWQTSLPCTVPWCWVVTLTWGTSFTQTATASGSHENFKFAVRGEANQTINNQNYLVGSGNERSLASGGISFLEDTALGVAIQSASEQEWGYSYFQVDAMLQNNRDPSGAGLEHGFDTASVGTGGTIFRIGSTSINPGKPADAKAIYHEGRHQMTGVSNTVMTLCSAANFGGGLSAGGGHPACYPIPDGRCANIYPDPIFTPICMLLPLVFTTGGIYRLWTGDVGFSGQAQTIPLDLGLLKFAGLPIKMYEQGIAMEGLSFSFITSADVYYLE